MYQEHCETRRTKKPNKEERKELTHGLSLFELRRGLLETKEHVFFAIHRGRKMKKRVGGEDAGKREGPRHRAVAPSPSPDSEGRRVRVEGKEKMKKMKKWGGVCRVFEEGRRKGVFG